jgi:hypothetical protein
MNVEEKINTVSAEFESNLNRDVMSRLAYNKDSWERRLKQASLIRTSLFKYVMYGECDPDGLLARLGLPVSNADVVDGLRMGNGYRVPRTRDVLDYALVNGLPEENYGYNRLLVGERRFLYLCFKRFYEGPLPDTYSDLLYVYLLVKIHFRGELVQVNDNSGFRNFNEYQNRKNVAIDPEKLMYYCREQVYLALNEALTQHNMKGLEARISPLKTLEKTHSLIRDIHQAYHDTYEEIPFGRPEHGKPQVFPYHYVFHFHKQADEPLNRSKSEFNGYRNLNARNDVESKARVLVDLINGYPQLRYIFKGIDGCSHEKGCRPEVMAHVFRYMSGFTPEHPGFLYDGPASVELKRTYHCCAFFGISPGIDVLERLGIIHRRLDKVFQQGIVFVMLQN